MNQTKKRLKIIKLAISITDIETIQLQMFKLSPLKTDLRIQEIITGLQAENYAQTQALITTYIETPMDEIIQRTAQEAREQKSSQEKDIIDEFDLFVTSSGKQKEITQEEFDFTALESEIGIKKEYEDIDFDALLNIEANDVLSGNIESKDTFFDKSHYPKKDRTDNSIETKEIPKDTFFDTKKSPAAKNIQKEKTDTHLVKKVRPSPQINDPAVIQKKSTITESVPSKYNAIPYINQKLKNMQTQYPPIEEAKENFPSVDAWLLQISNDGYKSDEVEEIIKHITKLTQAGNLAEAAQLLLISGATQSKYAQFILARALYKGDLLQKNLPESFTLINRLAMDDNFPEAICDLAQFYEHGIGIGKDQKRAETLYKEAMDLDIRRALDHYERVRKYNSGLFSSFRK